MQTALQFSVESRARGGVEVRLTTELLRRHAYLERSCIRALAGWFLKVPAYEAKIVLGHQLWGHAERVDAIRRRLGELRGGHADASIEPALSRVGEALLHAPDEGSFLAGLGWLQRHLAVAYRSYLNVADVAANAMEIRLLHHLLSDIERDRAAIGAAFPREPQPAAGQWTDYLESLLDGAGGMTGLEPRPHRALPCPYPGRFERPSKITFDQRIHCANLLSQEQRLALPFERRRVEDFKVYFNEFYAAALLASILYDAWNASAPWEFFFDMSHHFWDEVRHAEFGLRRLRELGIEPSTINPVLFEQAQGMPFLHRLCYLTLGLEVFFMPRKRPRVLYYAAAGDVRSQLFSDVDWSDEINHVRYGKRWIDYFLEDDARTIADIQAEIANHRKADQAHVPAGELAPF